MPNPEANDFPHAIRWGMKRQPTAGVEKGGKGYPGDMAEVALSHRISITVEAAYRRGDVIVKRRKMMEDWAQFQTGAGCDPASDRDANAQD